MEIEEYLLENLNTSLISDPTKINPQFDLVAKYLLNNCSISVNERTYHLSEIEFYYFSDKHPDPYVHKHDNQKQIGLWYFHNAGQDFTFGSDGNYGGILIRAVRDENSGNYLDGPLKTFDELFNKGLLLHNKNSFRITIDDKKENTLKDVFAYPRVGLNPKGKEKGLKYILNPIATFPSHGKQTLRGTSYTSIKSFLLKTRCY